MYLINLMYRCMFGGFFLITDLYKSTASTVLSKIVNDLLSNGFPYDLVYLHPTFFLHMYPKNERYEYGAAWVLDIDGKHCSMWMGVGSRLFRTDGLQDVFLGEHSRSILFDPICLGQLSRSIQRISVAKLKKINWFSGLKIYLNQLKLKDLFWYPWN